MQAILDSSFIINSIKNKIDFIAELQQKGFKIVVPREVIQEMRDLRLKTRFDERIAINLALEMFEKESKKIKKIKLGKRNVDEGLIFAGKRGIYIATTDNAIKRAVQNKITLSAVSKGIVIERE
jgi:rRNA-processing protein FCF1